MGSRAEAPLRTPGTTINPVIIAEQALLGALLLRPELRTRVNSLVTADDFYRPAHAALYKALTDDTIHSVWSADHILGLLVRAGEEAAGLTAVYAHTLMSGCPRAEHAPAYARIVAEAATCRRIREHAHRLRQVAHTDLQRGGVDETLRHLDTLHHSLDRARTATAPPGTHAITPAPTASPQTLPAPHPDELALLRGLTADPAQLDTLAWLQEDDFSEPAQGALFAALRNLHRRHDPIDPVLVTWEAYRTGPLTNAALGDILAALGHGVGGTGVFHARHILRRALLHRTVAAADAITAVAATQRPHPHHLATAARRLLAPVDATRRRWTAANTPGAPPPRGARSIRGPTAAPAHLPATAVPHRR